MYETDLSALEPFRAQRNGNVSNRFLSQFNSPMLFRKLDVYATNIHREAV